MTINWDDATFNNKRDTNVQAKWRNVCKNKKIGKAIKCKTIIKK